MQRESSKPTSKESTKLLSIWNVNLKTLKNEYYLGQPSLIHPTLTYYITWVSLSPPPPPALRTLPRRVVIIMLSTKAPLRHCTDTTRSSGSSASTCSTGLSLSELHFGEVTHIAVAALKPDVVSDVKVHCTPFTSVSPRKKKNIFVRYCS